MFKVDHRGILMIVVATVVVLLASNIADNIGNGFGLNTLSDAITPPGAD